MTPPIDRPPSTNDYRPPLLTRLGLQTLRALGALGLGWQVVRLQAALGQRFNGQSGDPFAGYRPRAGEIVVCTYAKSGTNWMLQITQQLIGRGGVDFPHIHDLVPWPDHPFATRPLAQLADPPDPRVPGGRRVIKTHLPATAVPLVDDATYLAVFRDPCDVCVSAYHFVGGIINGVMRFDPTPAQWVDHFASPQCSVGSWPEHTATWWEACKTAGRHAFFFEDMKRDLPGAVRRVAELTGVEADDALIDTVVERSGFAYMKAHEPQFAPLAPVIRGERTRMMRSGKSGASGELLTAAQQAQIRDYCRAELERLGSDFPFERYAG